MLKGLQPHRLRHLSFLKERFIQMLATFVPNVTGLPVPLLDKEVRFYSR